jgi:hypothetical protein
MRWAGFDYAAGPRAGRVTGVRLQEKTMLGKISLTSMTAATLLAWPAFAGWPSAQTAQVDAVDGQRIIREVVTNGGLIGADSDEPLANELRPIPDWIDHGSALDRRPEHLW